MTFILIGFLIAVLSAFISLIDKWKKRKREGYRKTNTIASLTFIIALLGSTLTYEFGIKAYNDKNITAIENKNLSDSLKQSQQAIISLLKDQLDTTNRVLALSESLNIAQTKIGKLQQENLSSITGGDNYPIMRFRQIFVNAAILGIENRGKYTLYDISYDLRDVDSFNLMISGSAGGSDYFRSIKEIKIGNLSPLLVHQEWCTNVNFNKKEGNIKVQFLARNGIFVQYFKYRKKNNQHYFATKIVNMSDSKKIVYRRIESGFLNKGEKEIKWVEMLQ